MRISAADRGDLGRCKAAARLFDVHHVPRELVRTRLLKRHGEEGSFTEERNRAYVERNDLPNFGLVAMSQDRADVVITMDVER